MSHMPQLSNEPLTLGEILESDSGRTYRMKKSLLIGGSRFYVYTVQGILILHRLQVAANCAVVPMEGIS
jgi:hypothetical protein